MKFNLFILFLLFSFFALAEEISVDLEKIKAQIAEESKKLGHPFKISCAMQFERSETKDEISHSISCLSKKTDLIKEIAYLEESGKIYYFSISNDQFECNESSSKNAFEKFFGSEALKSAEIKIDTQISIKSKKGYSSPNGPANALLLCTPNKKGLGVNVYDASLLEIKLQRLKKK